MYGTLGVVLATGIAIDFRGRIVSIATTFLGKTHRRVSHGGCDEAGRIE